MRTDAAAVLHHWLASTKVTAERAAVLSYHGGLTLQQIPLRLNPVQLQMLGLSLFIFALAYMDLFIFMNLWSYLLSYLQRAL